MIRIITILLIILIFLLIDNFNNKKLVEKFNNKKLVENINNKKLVENFNNNGYLIIPNILDNVDCNNILKIIDNEEKNDNILGEINSQYKRKDLMLNIKDVDIYINKVYNKIKNFIDSIIPDSTIIECSSLISEKGSYPQIWHTDIDPEQTYKNYANLVSFGIYLDDINDEMGPLEVYPKSNKLFSKINNLYEKYNLNDYNEEQSNKFNAGLNKQSIVDLMNIFKLKKKLCSGKKGSIVIWSSKIVHRGGENKLKKRPVFYFSLIGKGPKPEGATYSLKQDINPIKIKDL